MEEQHCGVKMVQLRHVYFGLNGWEVRVSWPDQRDKQTSLAREKMGTPHAFAPMCATRELAANSHHHNHLPPTAAQEANEKLPDCTVIVLTWKATQVSWPHQRNRQSLHAPKNRTPHRTRTRASKHTRELSSTSRSGRRHHAQRGSGKGVPPTISRWCRFAPTFGLCCFCVKRVFVAIRQNWQCYCEPSLLL